MDVMNAVKALKDLEGQLGRTPSVREIADKAGCSDLTVQKYLQYAVGARLIEQRDGKYMSLEIARAYDAQK